MRYVIVIKQSSLVITHTLFLIIIYKKANNTDEKTAVCRFLHLFTGTRNFFSPAWNTRALSVQIGYLCSGLLSDIVYRTRFRVACSQVSERANEHRADTLKSHAIGIQRVGEGATVIENALKGIRDDDGDWEYSARFPRCFVRVSWTIDSRSSAPFRVWLLNSKSREITPIIVVIDVISSNELEHWYRSYRCNASTPWEEYCEV